MPHSAAGYDLLDLAGPYALHALDAAELAAVESARAGAAAAARAEFDSLVNDYRETMAAQSHSTAVAPPTRVLDAVLESISTQAPTNAKPAAEQRGTDRPAAAVSSLADARRRRRSTWVAGISAAAAVVAITVAGVTVAQRPTGTEPVTAQVLAAPDVRTAAVPIDGGGTATVVFSKDVNAAVLVMNDVTPPSPGTVYQMWLTGPDHDPISKGVMDPDAVSPSTQALLEGIDSSTALSFSLEPTGGSAQPTEVFASVALT